MYYKITAFPDAKKEFVEVKNDRYRVFVREPAQNNQANKAVVRIFAQYLDIKERELRIIKGRTSTSKIIEKISL